MARTIGIGIQSFEKIRKEKYFYIDKTSFIKEWWESGDDVTLITRPRRFGKTLNMNMLETFFSVECADKGDLFEGLAIWKEEKYRNIQGTYPVISLSFAGIKESNYETAWDKICEILRSIYIKFSFLKDSNVLENADRNFFNQVLEPEMKESVATLALHHLSDYLQRYYGKKGYNSFGFTTEEVLEALQEYDLSEEKEKVQAWYDGFSFGKYTGIYNPWSILNYLDKKIFNVYWANTSANTLISNLLQSANPDIKSEFEELLRGNSIHKTIDEQIVYDQLGQDESAIWSLEDVN